MCGTPKKAVVETPIKRAINAVRASQDGLSNASDELVLQANKVEKLLDNERQVTQQLSEDLLNANKAADDLNNTVLEQARIIVNLESRLADASQAIAAVDKDIAPFFAPREVDTNDAAPIVAEAPVIPARRGRIAIERKQGGHCGIPLEWVQVDVVEAGAEEDAIKFLKSEDSFATFRAVTLIEAL